jgi:hypothetical protein
MPYFATKGILGLAMIHHPHEKLGWGGTLHYSDYALALNSRQITTQRLIKAKNVS